MNNKEQNKKITGLFFIAASAVASVFLLINWPGFLQICVNYDEGYLDEFIAWSSLVLFIALTGMLAVGIWSLFTKNKIINIAAVVFCGLIFILIVVFLGISAEEVRGWRDSENLVYQTGLIEILICVFVILGGLIFKLIYFWKSAEKPARPIDKPAEKPPADAGGSYW